MASTAGIRRVLFDAYGTLFDVYSVGHLAERLFPGAGDRLAALWRDKQIEYTRLRTMSAPDGRHYKPFWDVTRDALRFAAARLALPLDAPAETALMGQYWQLSAFPENREVLAALRERGVATGVLSNGDPPMLAAAVNSAGLAGFLSPLLSVDSVRRFKTDPSAYALGPAAFGCEAREILFVSSNAWDAVGATWFGYTTMWLNRAGAPPEQLGALPHHVGRDLRDVLAIVG